MIIKSHLPTKFIVIIFLICNNISPLEPKNDRITKELITKVCSESPNPSLCYDLLKDLIGHPLTNTTTSTMARRPLTMAQSQAKATRMMLESLYKGLIDPSRDVKQRYQRCMRKFDDVIKFLEQGKRYLREGEFCKISEMYASSASHRIESCDREFAGKVLKEPLALEKANKKLKDLCGIIAEICSGDFWERL